MAKTYTASAIGVAFASNKSLLGLLNAHATRKVKLYRAWTLAPHDGEMKWPI